MTPSLVTVPDSTSAAVLVDRIISTVAWWRILGACGNLVLLWFDSQQAKGRKGGRTDLERWMSEFIWKEKDCL